MTDSIASPLVIEPGEAKIGGSVILEASPGSITSGEAMESVMDKFL